MTLFRRRQAKLDRMLRSETTGALVQRVVEAIRYEQWGRLEAGSIILERDGWTEQALLDALEVLYRELLAEDDAHGRSGRDSNAFEFHDCGLAAICEALRDRVGGPTRSGR